MNGPQMGKKNNLGSIPNDDLEDENTNDGPTENLLKPGTKIAKEDFLMLKVIGRGSFGKVYLVRNKATGLPFAMKILKKDQLIKKNLLIKTQGKFKHTRLTRYSRERHSGEC